MNEFDLRKFLYRNPLLEKKEDSKKGNKEEQKRMEGAIRDDRDHIKDLKSDIEDNEKKLAKLKKDFKKDVNEMYDSKYEEDDVKEYDQSSIRNYELDNISSKAKNNPQQTKVDRSPNPIETPDVPPSLTKEGLKSMIREKITSILNEEDKMDEGAKYYEDDMKEAEEVDVDVDEKEDIDVDIEKDVKVDDVQDREEIEVDAEVAGQSADDSGLEGLLKKAREMARDQGNDKLVRQISNTIIQHERSIAADEEA